MTEEVGPSGNASDLYLGHAWFESAPNKSARAVTLVISVRELLGSNLGLVTKNPDRASLLK
jgi:hypothetical protein